MKTTYTILLILIWLSAYAQNDSLRNETHIFWSEQYQVQIEDFQAITTTEKNTEACEKYNLCWSAYTGLFSVMDVPKKKRYRNQKAEVIYFAPAFEVATSYKLTKDSMDYLKQVLVFDMYEVAARKARIELDSLYDVNPSIGWKAIFFKSVEAEVQGTFGRMVRGYTQEVYIAEIEGAYEKWRKEVDDMLNETYEYRTTAKDRQRFITNEPIVEGYIESPHVVDNLFKD